MNILFVCLGNICRSPLAEGILKSKLEGKNILFNIESAGFESYHINEAPDPRALKMAQIHGIDISENRCRLFTTEDFDNFNIIYIMDASNYRDVQYFSRTEEDMEKVKYLLSELEGKDISVPDPYYGTESGFENTYNLIDQACNKIAEMLDNNNTK